MLVEALILRAYSLYPINLYHGPSFFMSGPSSMKKLFILKWAEVVFKYMRCLSRIMWSPG